jgi:hypothetical protein
LLSSSIRLNGSRLATGTPLVGFGPNPTLGLRHFPRLTTDLSRAQLLGLVNAPYWADPFHGDARVDVYTGPVLALHAPNLLYQYSTEIIR